MSTADPITRLNAALEGRYRIERQLGEGGMATVYLADDLRHERKVALKVLKPELAAVVGADRFLTEIKTTANLQHPHILPLFDSGEADSFLFYVMPYVEGESLRERLDRERQLPVEEAVRITTSVADALDHAHRHGVIHRDIKPANILLVEGQPVLSDFGIALAVGTAGGGRLTETGLSLGTPHYMSPEQATGDQTVGQATDIYALGCVLYEMLTGDPPYTGSTAQAILGKIIQAKPVSATEARRSVPVHVDAAIRKALEKLSADRFGSAKELARALADPGFRHGEPGPAELANGRRWTRRSVVFASLFGATALLLIGSLLRIGPPATPAQTVSFTVPVGEGADVYLGGVRDAAWGRPASRSLALSPDGRLLAYSGWTVDSDGQITARLYLRRIDREEAVPLQGTEGAASPFFSPDGAWIGFVDSLSLRRVSLVERDVETIAQDAAPSQEGASSRGKTTLIIAGAAWSEDGVIAYAGPEGLYRVTATGGEPELILKRDTVPGGLVAVGHPDWLPGGRMLLLAGARSSDPEDAEVFALDPATGARTTVLTNALNPHYVEPGILIFMRLGVLMAVAFDPGMLEVRGEPVAMVEDVMQALSMPNNGWETGLGQVAFSRSGHLAYASGGLYPPALTTLWRVHADGTTDSLSLEPRRYLHLRLSPDGRRLAFSAGPGLTLDLFVRDFDRGVTQRLTTDFARSYGPEWSPDGRTIAFTANREDGVANLYTMPADGSGPPEPLAPSTQGRLMGSWSSTGAMAFLQGGEIWILPPDGEPAPFVVSEGASMESPTFSPDGRWLAYTVLREGRPDVYVRPYPGPGPATLVSENRGNSPAWSHDGRRLYYVGPQGDPPHGALMAVDIEAGDEIHVGRAVPHIDPWRYTGTVPIRSQDVADDGSFIVSRLGRDDAIPGETRVGPQRMANRIGQIHVVLNWFDELRERVATH